MVGHLSSVVCSCLPFIYSIIKQIEQEVATELAGAGGGGAAWAVEAANLANLRSRAIEVLFYLFVSLLVCLSVCWFVCSLDCVSLEISVAIEV